MGRFRSMTLSILVLILLGAPAAPLLAQGETLAGIKTRGVLRCGVSEGIPGFSAKDSEGRWQGLDADFCRAVAAAVLGDAGRVEFVPLRASTRFPALQSRKIDLLVRNTTWTLAREAVLKAQFPGILFVDEQGLLVPRAAGISHLTQLDHATVCLERGTNHGRNLERYGLRSGLVFTPLVLDSTQEVATAFFAGRCTAYTGDVAQLTVTRLSAPSGTDDYVILPERIAKQPLGPVVWGGDPVWETIVRWVLFTLFIAEEEGMTRDNAEARLATGVGELAWLPTPERKLIGESLGLSPGWAMRAVKAVGHYGELFDRTVGRGSPLQLERGLNRLWNQGGLLYPPPID